MVFTPGDIVEVQGTCWSYKNPMTIKQLPRGTVAVVVEAAEAGGRGWPRGLHILLGGELMWIASELACPLAEEMD